MNCKVGDVVERKVEVTDEKVRKFAEVTGDDNPLHLDDDYAAKTIFKKRVAHGMLSAGFLSGLLAKDLPGPGAVYLKQSFRFLKPVYIGDTLRIRGEIININRRGYFTISTKIFRDSDNVLLVDGECLSMMAEG